MRVRSNAACAGSASARLAWMARRIAAEQIELIADVDAGIVALTVAARAGKPIWSPDWRL